MIKNGGMYEAGGVGGIADAVAEAGDEEMDPDV